MTPTVMGFSFAWGILQVAYRETHRGRPFQGREDFLCAPVLGRTYDLALLIQAGHPLRQKEVRMMERANFSHSRFIVK